MKLCKCELQKHTDEIGYWDGCPLEGFAHTSFAVEQCRGCGGICGFPQSNFELALTNGTVKTKEKLNEIAREFPRSNNRNGS